MLRGRKQGGLRNREKKIFLANGAILAGPALKGPRSTTAFFKLVLTEAVMLFRLTRAPQGRLVSRTEGTLFATKPLRTRERFESTRTKFVRFAKQTLAYEEDAVWEHVTQPRVEAPGIQFGSSTNPRLSDSDRRGWYLIRLNACSLRSALRVPARLYAGVRF